MSIASAHRRAENEARFRQANDAIHRKAEELEVDVAPFLCECPDEQCRELVLLPLAEFRRLLARDVTFVVAPGHATEHETVLEARDGYDVIHKEGEEARLLREERADG